MNSSVVTIKDTFNFWLAHSEKHELVQLLLEIEKKKTDWSPKLALLYQKKIEKLCFTQLNSSYNIDKLTTSIKGSTIDKLREIYLLLLTKEVWLKNLVNLGITAEILHSIFLISLINLIRRKYSNDKENLYHTAQENNETEYSDLIFNANNSLKKSSLLWSIDNTFKLNVVYFIKEEKKKLILEIANIKKVIYLLNKNETSINIFILHAYFSFIDTNKTKFYNIIFEKYYKLLEDSELDSENNTLDIELVAFSSYLESELAFACKSEKTYNNDITHLKSKFNKDLKIIKKSLLNLEKDEYTEKYLKKSYTSGIALSMIELGINAGYFESKKNELNSIKEIWLSHQVLHEILEIGLFTNIKLPMLVPPLNFRKVNQIYSGGYLISKKYIEATTDIINILINNPTNLNIVLNQGLIDAINYLQSQKLNIIKELLDDIFSIQNDHFKSSKHIFKSKIDLNSIFYHYGDPANRDFNAYTQASTFMLTLLICKTLCGLDFYFNWNVDSRGRVYSSNNPFNFYTNKLIRNIVTFAEMSDDLDDLDILKFNSLPDFEKSAFLKCKNRKLIGIDATASLYQIIGSLMRSQALLRDTNVISSDTKHDIYDVVRNYFYNNKYSNIYSDIHEKYIVFVNKYKNESYKNYIELTYDFMKKLNNLDRKFIKRIVMTFGYNNSIKTISEELADDLEINIKFRKQVGVILRPLSTAICKSIEELYPDIKNIKKFFSILVTLRLLNQNNSIELTIPMYNSHNFLQRYQEVKFTRIWVWSKVNSAADGSKKRKVSQAFYKYVNCENIDLNKNKKALLPNFVQYLDSVLLVYVLLKCKDNSINLLPIHDCFYSLTKDHKLIKDFYIEAIINVLLNEDILEHLTKINEISPPKDESKINIRRFNKIYDIKNAVNSIDSTQLNSIIEKIKKSKYILW